MKKILPFVMLLVTTFASGCQRSEQTTLTPATALEAALGALHGCLPANLTSADPGTVDLSHLAIEAVEHEIMEANGRATAQTRVRLVAWSETNPATLTLPLYTLSRGRWLLDTSDRVYLVDQECRQYPLLDVQFTSRRSAPGTIRLAPGQAVGGSLIFPPPGPRARLGTLVYGRRTLPIRFPVSVAPRQAATSVAPSGTQASGR